MASVGRCSNGVGVGVGEVGEWGEVPGRSKTRAVWTREGEPDEGKVEKSRDKGAERMER